MEQIAARGGKVALILADLRLPDVSGIELLARVHGLDRDWLVRAAVLGGQVGDWGLKPWQPGEEEFHQLVVGLLAEWAQLHRPGFEAVQVVDEQWSARSYALPERVGAITTQLPVVVTFDGLVLQNPSFVEVAHALSAPTRPAGRPGPAP